MTSIPKGKLIPIGGNEAKKPAGSKGPEPTEFFESEVLPAFIEEIPRKNPRIEVVPAASTIPGEMGDMYLDAFDRFGCRNVGVIHIDAAEDTDNKENLRRLEEADGIIFTGGDQVRLVDKLYKSRFAEILKERYYQEEFVIAGTSAGAMAMSSNMVKEGYSKETLFKGMVDMGRGLGLFEAGIFDTHFMKRGRLGRLTEALVNCKGCVAFGISEDTGMVITGGNEMRAIGSGVIIILEADDYGINNYKSAHDSHPVYIENLRMHVLAAGSTYLLKERKLIANAEG